LNIQLTETKFSSTSYKSQSDPYLMFCINYYVRCPVFDGIDTGPISAKIKFPRQVLV